MLWGEKKSFSEVSFGLGVSDDKLL